MWRGLVACALVCAGAAAVILSLWLVAGDAPSSAGQPFRFTPPPETPRPAATAPTPLLTPAAMPGS